MTRARLFISASADASLKDQYIEKLQVVKGTIIDGEVITAVHDVMTHEPTDLDLILAKLLVQESVQCALSGMILTLFKVMKPITMLGSSQTNHVVGRTICA
jgi:hypothetical protein